MSDTSRATLTYVDGSRAAFRPAERPVTFSQEELDDAYARGFLAGTDDADAETRRATVRIADGLTQARAAVVEELRRIDAARRDEIVDFAFEVARWLVQAEIRLEPKRILARLEAAMPDRPDEIVVRVAAALVPVVQHAVPGVKVLADPALGLGDLRIIGPDSQIEATVEDALDRLRVFLAADDDGAVR